MGDDYKAEGKAYNKIFRWLFRKKCGKQVKTLLTSKQANDIFKWLARGDCRSGSWKMKGSVLVGMGAVQLESGEDLGRRLSQWRIHRQCRRPGFNPWVGNVPWISIHSSIPAWGITWTEEPDRLQSWGLQTVAHNWTTDTLPFYTWETAYHRERTAFLWPLTRDQVIILEIACPNNT